MVKELHYEKVIGGFDAAVITKDADGKVHVNKDESATRKGGWLGGGVGAVVGLVFPPALIGSAVVGAAAGAFAGHLKKGLSRSEMKEIGELLEAGEAGLVVLGDWRLEERIFGAHEPRRPAGGQGAPGPRPGGDREADRGDHVRAGLGDATCPALRGSRSPR